MGEEPVAFQIAIGDNGGEWRLNDTVEGVLCATLTPSKTSPGSPYLYVTLELPQGDAARMTHYTAIIGHSLKGIGALVFWDRMPSVIRRMSGDTLITLVEKGIAVPGARGRFEKLRKRGLLPEDVRSALWEGHSQGVDPSHLGSWVVDACEKDELAGLPSRKAPYTVVLESELAPEGSPMEAIAAVPESPIDLSIDMERAIADLPSIRQKILALSSKGYSQEEIAAEIGMSQQAVGQHLKAARLALLARLGPSPG
jgi:DNA-binding transcriptional ArsR family regulator